MSHLQKILGISSPPLGVTLLEAGVADIRTHGRLGAELSDFLKLKNGLYAFESALHIFPAHRAANGWSLDEWNADNLWRCEYHGLTKGLLFFAEEAFGNQFCLRDDAICFFDSETGECRELADSFEAWAKVILEDYEFQTGYPLLHEWQKEHGPLSESQRLVPKKLRQG